VATAKKAPTMKSSAKAGVTNKVTNETSAEKDVPEKKKRPKPTRRPSWDETFMNRVIELARRPHCVHYKVACAFVNPNNREICSGYNGPAPGRPHCDDPFVGCNKERNPPLPCIGNHAEDNAIREIKGALNEELAGSTMYTTLFPCTHCMKNVCSNGTKRIVYLRVYKRKIKGSDTQGMSDFESALFIARDFGVKVECWDPKTKTTKRTA